MKLGIIMPPKPESFEQAKELGLDFVEFDCNPADFFGAPMAELTARQEELKAASQRAGIEVGAVGRWASHILDENGQVKPAEWDEVKAVIDFGAYLGAKHYLCSVNYVKELSYYKNITAAIQVLKDIVAYAKEKGMETAIVNCCMGGNYIRTPEQWKLVLSEVPGLGIKYDPSHSFVHGGQNGAYLEEGLEWGAHFKYCHVKGVIQRGDSREEEQWAMMDLAKAHPELKEELMAKTFGGSNWYDNPPAGIDVINWRAFFAILYKYGYDGYLAIEPHSPTWQGELGQKGLRYTIKYIRDLML
ncbi:MAG: sugar phosphate isomerase/epimerase [Acutalibacter sp.]|jgi:sugar phosphate isomerase/epimerase|nr:sugar phosphate isomerase/epimerase [Acutalibacter sp.]